MPSLTRVTLLSLAVLACGGPLITERKDEQGLTALMRAARAPDTTLVATLVAKGADVNAQVPPRDLRDVGSFFRQLPDAPRTTIGYTALHFAVQHRRLDNVRLLIANGADPRLAARLGVTPLSLAVIQDSDEMAQLLVKAGARPDPSVAAQAVWNGKPALVAAMYGNGADPNATAPLPGMPGFRPLLVIATMRGEPAIVRTLLAAGAHHASRDPVGWSALRWAHDAKLRKQAGADELIAILDSVGAQDDGGLKALELAHAVSAKDLSRVRAALRAGASPNARDVRGVPPLIHAAGLGDTSIAQALIAAGARVDYAPLNSVSPLTSTIEKGDVAMARVLLAAGARGDKKDGFGREPLKLTASYRRAAIAALILADSTVRVQGAHLSEAAFQGDSAQVRLLLDHGVDANHANGSVLYAAARGCVQHGNTSLARILLERGARPSPRPFASVLHSASFRCDPEFIRLLVQYGDSINGRDFDGMTPLMIAVSRGRIENVRALIAAGADVNARDNYGRSVATFARQPEMRQLLVASGATYAFVHERRGPLRGFLAWFR